MKNKSIQYLILTTLAMIPVCLFSQDQIAFRVIYKPDMIYDLLSESTMSMKINEKSAEALKKELDEEQIASFNKNAIRKSTTKIITGHQDLDGKFPMTVMENNDMEGLYEMFSGSMTYTGRMNASGIESIDSISSENGYIPSLQNINLESLKQFSLEKFPERIMAVGDSFEILPTINLPGFSDFREMNARSVFILERIDQNKAYFKSIETYQMSFPRDENNKINYSGNGTGLYVYDTDQNHFIESSANQNFIGNITFQAKSIMMEIIINHKSNIEIHPN